MPRTQPERLTMADETETHICEEHARCVDCAEPICSRFEASSPDPRCAACHEALARRRPTMTKTADPTPEMIEAQDAYDWRGDDPPPGSDDDPRPETDTTVKPATWVVRDPHSEIFETTATDPATVAAEYIAAEMPGAYIRPGTFSMGYDGLDAPGAADITYSEWWVFLPTGPERGAPFVPTAPAGTIGNFHVIGPIADATNERTRCRVGLLDDYFCVCDGGCDSR